MTHPTKAIYNMLLADFVKLNRGGGDDPLFTEQDLAGARRRSRDSGLSTALLTCVP
jgi:cleavage and polyadenylation specificity factor subunit 3